MRTLYHILFLVAFPLSAPYYFLKMWRRGNWRADFRQRFGEYGVKVKQAVTNRDVLWMHAVSVGEVNLCTQLIRVLEARAPNLKIVVSTTTTTGMGELRRKLPSHITSIYYPIDARGYVARAVAALHPNAVVLVEAELWPNFLWRLQDRGTPVVLVNARLSERSYRGYRRFHLLFRPLFGSLAAVGAQNEADAARLRELGCRPEAVRVVGSLKFDAAAIEERRNLDVTALLAQVGVPPNAPILVAGSTHPGEEALLAELLPRLRARFPDLFLVLVPRHFERGREVGRELEARKVKFRYRSEVVASTRVAPRSLECLLVNTTGELKYFYEAATVVFVGKSLVGQGGQNPIEPGALGKAMVFGPHMQNFAAVAASFVAARGALQVRDAAELERALGELLADPGRRETMGRQAQAVVRANSGAVERTAELILEALDLEATSVAGTG